MLTHLIPCIHIIFHTIQAIHFMQITHGHFRSNTKVETVFNGPKNSVWAVHRQPPHQHRLYFLGTEIRGHFRPHNTKNHNLTHKYNTSHTNSSWIVQNGSLISSISVLSFGTDQTAIHDLKHSKSLTKLLNKD